MSFEILLNKSFSCKKAQEWSAHTLSRRHTRRQSVSDDEVKSGIPAACGQTDLLN